MITRMPARKPRITAWVFLISTGVHPMSDQINKIVAGTFKAGFDWFGPDWKNINNPDTSMIGFTKGAALSADASANLDKFIAELAGGLNLWTGPLNFQDGRFISKMVRKQPICRSGTCRNFWKVWKARAFLNN